MNALILTTDQALKLGLQQLCASLTPPINLVKDMPGMLRLDPIAMTEPDLILFDARGNQAEVLSSLDRITDRHPLAVVLMLAPERSPDLLIAAMRRGVREVIGLPINSDEFEIAIDRIATKRREQAREEGKVYTVISGKGGSGATFIAVNLAHALATIVHKKTLLIDLNLKYGDAALFVSDSKPDTTLSDLCAQIHRLDAQLLESIVIHAGSNFDVLPASSDPDPEDCVRPDHISSLMTLAKRHYDYVLLDVGRQVNAVSIRALDGSDLIFPVIQQSLPFIRNGQRMLDMFSTLGYPKDSIRHILNRYSENSVVSVADLERGLGQRIAYQVPNNFTIASDSINQGEPVLSLSRNSPIARSFIKLVQSLTEQPNQSSYSMIRRLFSRAAAVSN
jgi:pilus assembly protein CpaE